MSLGLRQVTCTLDIKLTKKKRWSFTLMLLTKSPPMKCDLENVVLSK